MITLVTGGTGLLGAHVLLLLLQQGHRVRAVFRDEAKKAHTLQIFGYYTRNAEELMAKIEWFEADLTDFLSVREAMKDVSQVYHAAAMVSFLAKDTNTMIYNNRVTTAHMVNAALEAKVEGFCYISSVAALGESAGLVDEASERGKNKKYSAYSVSKYLAEMEVWRGIAEGLKATMVNPSIVIGPGDWRSSSTVLFAQVAKGMPFYTRGLTNLVAATDVARAMCLLMEKQAWGQRYILSAEHCQYADLFTQIAKALDKKPPRFEIKPWQMWVIHWFTSPFLRILGQKELISKDMARSAFSKTIFSSQKIVTQFEFRFTPIGQTIDTVASMYINAHKN